MARLEGLLCFLLHSDIEIVLHHLGGLWIELLYDFVAIAEPPREVDVAASCAAKWEQRFRILGIWFEFSLANRALMWSDHNSQASTR